MSANERILSSDTHSARLEMLGSLASGIAHEINTPIQFIGDNLHFVSSSFESIDRVLASYDALRLAIGDNPALKDQLQDLEQALEAAEIDFLREELPGAIEQSLAGIQNVARIASAMKAFAHRGSADKELADINQSIEMTAAISRNEWKYHADIELSLEPTLPAINCHIGELSQVWLNLIVNAAHAIKTRPEGGRGLIEVASGERDGAVEITVSDNGAGIPGDVRDKIFEPFFSTKPSGEGSGQGLHVCREIICGAHEGDIQVWSEPDKGARFTVRLPIEPSPLVTAPLDGALA